MGWRQVKPFDIAKAGNVLYACLKNTRLGYSISSKWDYALQDWNSNVSKHSDRNFPSGVTVPVYFNWVAPKDIPSAGIRKGVNYGHIGVRLPDGRIWTDGRYYNNVDEVTRQYISSGGGGYLGWGESVNGVRVVEYVPDPAPAPKPATNIRVGTIVRPTRAVSYEDVALAAFVLQRDYPVTQIKGDRAVLGNGLNTAFRTADLRVVSQSAPTPAPAPAPAPAPKPTPAPQPEPPKEEPKHEEPAKPSAPVEAQPPEPETPKDAGATEPPVEEPTGVPETPAEAPKVDPVPAPHGRHDTPAQPVVRVSVWEKLKVVILFLISLIVRRVKK